MRPQLFQPVARARQALLSGLGLSVVLTLGLGLGLDNYWTVLRDPQYGSKLITLRSRLAEQPDRSLVLFLGSSRTEVGVRPALLTADDSPCRTPIVFNFGMAGCGPLQQLLCLRRLYADGIRPQCVLLEVLPPALHWDCDGAVLLQPERLTWGDLRRANRYCAQPLKVRAAWGQARLAGWFTTRFTLLSRLAPGWVPLAARRDSLWTMCDPLGWAKPFITAPTKAWSTVAFAHARTEYASALASFCISPLPDRTLRDAVEYCQTRRIPVALYVMPEGDTFRSWYPPGAYASVTQYVNNLGRDYSIPVFDTRTWMAETDFCDGHHLLGDAAARFSIRFGREMFDPWIWATNREVFNQQTKRYE